MRALLRRRVITPLRAQLTQGVAPAQLALALALGLAVGVIPVLGIATFICAGLAVAFRLNQPAIQVANYAAYPLQIFLFVPFFQSGARLFSEPKVTFTLSQLKAELAQDWGGTLSHYAAANLRAVAAWGLAAPLLAGLFFVALRSVLRRLPVRREAAAPSTEAPSTAQT